MGRGVRALAQPMGHEACFATAPGSALGAACGLGPAPHHRPVPASSHPGPQARRPDWTLCALAIDQLSLRQGWRRWERALSTGCVARLQEANCPSRWGLEASVLALSSGAWFPGLRAPGLPALPGGQAGRSWRWGPRWQTEDVPFCPTALGLDQVPARLPPSASLPCSRFPPAGRLCWPYFLLYFFVLRK